MVLTASKTLSVLKHWMRFSIFSIAWSDSVILVEETLNMCTLSWQDYTLEKLVFGKKISGINSQISRGWGGGYDLPYLERLLMDIKCLGKSWPFWGCEGKLSVWCTLCLKYLCQKLAL